MPWTGYLASRNLEDNPLRRRWRRQVGPGRQGSSRRPSCACPRLRCPRCRCGFLPPSRRRRLLGSSSNPCPCLPPQWASGCHRLKLWVSTRRPRMGSTRVVVLRIRCHHLSSTARSHLLLLPPTTTTTTSTTTPQTDLTTCRGLKTAPLVRRGLCQKTQKGSPNASF